MLTLLAEVHRLAALYGTDDDAPAIIIAGTVYFIALCYAPYKQDSLGDFNSLPAGQMIDFIETGAVNLRDCDARYLYDDQHYVMRLAY